MGKMFESQGAKYQVGWIKARCLAGNNELNKETQRMPD
jgi:hypothetical protein